MYRLLLVAHLGLISLVASEAPGAVIIPLESSATAVESGLDSGIEGSDRHIDRLPDSPWNPFKSRNAGESPVGCAAPSTSAGGAGSVVSGQMAVSTESICGSPDLIATLWPERSVLAIDPPVFQLLRPPRNA